MEPLCRSPKATAKGLRVWRCRRELLMGAGIQAGGDACLIQCVLGQPPVNSHPAPQANPSSSRRSRIRIGSTRVLPPVMRMAVRRPS